MIGLVLLTIKTMNDNETMKVSVLIKSLKDDKDAKKENWDRSVFRFLLYCIMET